MDTVLKRFELECLQRAVCIMITGAMITTPIKVPDMLLDLKTFGTAAEFAALIAAYRLPRLDLRNLGTGHM